MIMSCIWGTVHLALKLKHDHITSQFLAHFQLDMTEHWTEWVVRASLQNSQMIHSFVRCLQYGPKKYLCSLCKTLEYNVAHCNKNDCNGKRLYSKNLLT